MAARRQTIVGSISALLPLAGILVALFVPLAPWQAATAMTLRPFMTLFNIFMATVAVVALLRYRQAGHLALTLGRRGMAPFFAVFTIFWIAFGVYAALVSYQHSLLPLCLGMLSSMLPQALCRDEVHECGMTTFPLCVPWERIRAYSITSDRHGATITFFVRPRRLGPRKIAISCPTRQKETAAQVLRTYLPGQELELPVSWDGRALPQE